MSRCRHCGERDVELTVTIPADLSHTGQKRLAIKPIDWCIADLVRSLNAHGVRTRSSCCGHGRGPGEVTLEDGYVLVII